MAKFLGEAVQRPASAERAVLPMLERRTHPKFLFQLHRKAWSWDDTEGDWLPDLCRMPIDAGCGGVGLNPDGTENEAPARAARLAKGWAILENGDRRFADIVKGGHYLVRFAAARGHAYAPAWERPIEGSNGIEWIEDAATRRAFQRRIRDLAIVGNEVDYPVAMAAINRARERIRRQELRLAGAPADGLLAADLAARRALVARMEARIRAIYPDGNPEAAEPFVGIVEGESEPTHEERVSGIPPAEVVEASHA